MAGKTKGTAHNPGGIFCEKCGSPTIIKDSRGSEFLGMSAVRRRHQCIECEHRQTSIAFALPGDVDSNRLPAAVAELLNNYVQRIKGASLGDKLLMMELTKVISESYKPNPPKTRSN